MPGVAKLIAQFVDQSVIKGWKNILKPYDQLLVDIVYPISKVKITPQAIQSLVPFSVSKYLRSKSVSVLLAEASILNSPLSFSCSNTASKNHQGLHQLLPDVINYFYNPLKCRTPFLVFHEMLIQLAEVPFF